MNFLVTTLKRPRISVVIDEETYRAWFPHFEAHSVQVVREQPVA